MTGNPETERALQDVLEQAETRITPIRVERELAKWQLTQAPDDEAFARYKAAELTYRTTLSDRELLEEIGTRLNDSGVQDVKLRRWATLLKYEMAPHMFPEEVREPLLDKELKIQTKVRRFKPEIDEARSTVAEVYRTMAKNDDIDARRRAWEASKEVGPEIAQDIVELAKARNVASRSIGYPDFYRMNMELQEINETRLFSALSSFATETEDPYRRMKAQLDRLLSDKHHEDAINLEPWHTSDPFFSKVPSVFETNLDSLFAELDPMEWAPDYFKGVGLPVDGMLSKDAVTQASVFPKQEFTDIDRSGDMRLLLAPAPNKNGAEEILSALGKVLYTGHIDKNLPHTMRRPAHPSLLEAVGRFFSRRATDFEWLINQFALRGSQVRGMDKKLPLEMRFQQVIHGRWKMVLVHFERGLYRDPDQNQQNRWWDLVERFQLLRRPAGRDDRHDWAVHPYFMLSPVYAHNEILAEWHASQMASAMRRDLKLDDPVLWMDDERIGEWMIEKLFKHGAMWELNELMQNATGHPSRPNEFSAQFLKGF